MGGSLDSNASFCHFLWEHNWLREAGWLHRLCLVMLHIMWGRREQSPASSLAISQQPLLKSFFSRWLIYVVLWKDIGVSNGDTMIQTIRPAGICYSQSTHVSSTSHSFAKTSEHQSAGAGIWVTKFNQWESLFWDSVTNQRPENCHPSHPSADLPSSKMRHGPRPSRSFAAFPENLISPVTFLLAADLSGCRAHCTGLQWPFLWCCMSWTTWLCLQHCSTHCMQLWSASRPFCNTQKIEQ